MMTFSNIIASNGREIDLIFHTRVLNFNIQNFVDKI